MLIVRGIHKLSQFITSPMVTIGNFDGVHLGHRQIIQMLIDKAKARNGTSVVYTFRPHPQIVLHPEVAPQLLSTYDEKLDIFEKLGVDVVIEEPFGREFSEVEPEQFFTDVLLRGLSAEAILVGYDFAFGRERHGHLDVLRNFCKKSSIELTILPPFRIDGEVVSSSRIRRHLLCGEIETANRLLGSPFFYRGVVVKGDGRGRKIGFPTANCRIENKLLLPFGVYVTQTVVGGDQLYPSVTNIGVRPTFGGQSEGADLPVLVETHLINTTLDLYGSQLEVRFMRRLRDEKKFSGVDELKTQINQDIKAALAAAPQVRQ